MALVVKDDGKTFEVAPAGTRQAVCAFVVDLGYQKRINKYGEKIQHQIAIFWELSNKMTQGEFAGQPFLVHKFYNFSLNSKSNLTHDLECWLSKKISDEDRKEKGVDVEKFLGMQCMLTLSHYEDSNRVSRVNVDTVGPKMEGLPNLTVVNRAPPDWVEKIQSRAIPESQVENVAAQIGRMPEVNINGDDLPF